MQISVSFRVDILCVYSGKFHEDLGIFLVNLSFYTIEQKFQCHLAIIFFRFQGSGLLELHVQLTLG